MYEDYLIRYAWDHLGVPYIYGGNNRLQGMDCSGFVCEVLRSWGIINGDYSSQGLYVLFQGRGYKRTFTGEPKAIAFYGRGPGSIKHVSFCLDSRRCLEAGGGDKSTLTLEDAKKRGACVRLRLIKDRTDYLFSVLPNYRGVGKTPIGLGKQKE